MKTLNIFAAFALIGLVGAAQPSGAQTLGGVIGNMRNLPLNSFGGVHGNGGGTIGRAVPGRIGNAGGFGAGGMFGGQIPGAAMPLHPHGATPVRAPLATPPPVRRMMPGGAAPAGPVNRTPPPGQSASPPPGQSAARALPRPATIKGNQLPSRILIKR